MNDLMKAGMDFEKFNPHTILNIFHLKNNGDVVLDVGYGESQMEKVLW
jgi:ubiquinone/menaquinone biosynthesis C-methylase UbiE